MRRVDFAAAVAARAAPTTADPSLWAASTMGDLYRAETLTAISRAESPTQAIALARANLHSRLGSVWSDTVVLIVSEFGRTVDPNGTGGADHGIGGAAMVLGGAVKGGRVFADWPGLRAADRIGNRDLRPTQDLRHVFANILGNHLGYSRAEISETILPGYVFPETQTELFHT